MILRQVYENTMIEVKKNESFEICVENIPFALADLCDWLCRTYILVDLKG